MQRTILFPLILVLLPITATLISESSESSAAAQWSRLEIFVSVTAIGGNIKLDKYHSSTVYFEYDMLNGAKGDDFAAIKTSNGQNVNVKKALIFGNFNDVTEGSPMTGMIPWMQYTKQGTRSVRSCFDYLKANEKLDYGDNVCNSNTLMEIASFLKTEWRQTFICGNVYWTPFNFRTRMISFEPGHTLTAADSFMKYVNKNTAIKFSNIKQACVNLKPKEVLPKVLVKYALPAIFLPKTNATTYISRPYDGGCVDVVPVLFTNFEYCESQAPCAGIGSKYMNLITQKIMAFKCKQFNCTLKNGTTIAIKPSK